MKQGLPSLGHVIKVSNVIQLGIQEKEISKKHSKAVTNMLEFCSWKENQVFLAQ